MSTFATVAQVLGRLSPHRIPYVPGSAAETLTVGLPALAMTLPSARTIAQARTLPPIELGLNFTGVIEWLRIWAAPTEFRGMLIAA
jgi:hypothetical protein